MDKPRLLTIDEELRLLDWTYRNRSFRDYILILALLRTDLRTTELHDLIVSDVGTKEEIFSHLEVRAEIAHNGRSRSITISIELQKQLKRFLNLKQQCGQATSSQSFLFASARFPKIAVGQIDRIVREATQGAFGRPFQAHNLQHTFETCLMERDRAACHPPGMEPMKRTNRGRCQ